jgi:Putative amidoligase enzyme
MSCRSNQASHLMTSYARYTSGLADVQVSNLYHRLRRQIRSQGDEAVEFYGNRGNIDVMVEAIRRNPDLTERQRALLARRFERAAADAQEGRVSQAELIALDMLPGYAQSSANIMTSAVHSIVHQLGREGYVYNSPGADLAALSWVRNRIDELYRQQGRPSLMRLSRINLPDAEDDIPQDPYTRRALWELANTVARCTNCGQFYGQVGAVHTCPESFGADRTARPPEPAEQPAPEPTAPPEEEPLADWELELLNGYPPVEPQLPSSEEASDEALAILRRRLMGDPEPEPAAQEREIVPLRERIRTYYPYRGSTAVRVQMANASALNRAAVAAEPHQDLSTSANVVIPDPDGRGRFMVNGDVILTPVRRRGSRVQYSGFRNARCTCPQYRRNGDCPHLNEAANIVNGLIDANLTPQVHQRATPDEEALHAATTRVEEDIRADYTASVTAAEAARERFSTDGVTPYADSMETFQAAYDEAKARIDAGDTRIPYQTENVTNGVAVPGARTFGIELEIDFPDANDWELSANKEAVARELHEAGLSQHPIVHGWHYQGRAGGGYTTDPDTWTVEFDRSVDDVQGQRGCEIVSPIMHDTPETWTNLAKVCEIIERNGGRATVRTGLHVNIGAGDFNHTVENHNRLLALSAAYEDTLIRVSHNPESGRTHRGRTYCAPNVIPEEGFRRINDARVHNSHRALVNLDHVPGEGDSVRPSTRVEVRVFDGTVDPGRIQMNIKTSLALVEAAVRGEEPPPRDQWEPAGSHWSRYSANGRRRSLRGDEWEEDTQSTRRMADLLFTREEDKRQFVSAWALTRWQRR